MQVILTKSVRKLGKIGETVNVKDGFGRNYLIPKELAIRATKDNISKFSILQKELETKNTNNKSEAEIAAKALDGQHLTFVTQSAADGRLFGSVSTKFLAAEISKIANYNLNYSNILLDNPIKFNGVYVVQVALHPEVITSILVVVAKSDSEAQDALREYKSPTKTDSDEEEKAFGSAEKTTISYDNDQVEEA